MQKKVDLRAFSILCTVEAFSFAKIFYDLEERINLIPLMIFKKLGLEVPISMTIYLLIADQSVKRPVGI